MSVAQKPRSTGTRNSGFRKGYLLHRTSAGKGGPEGVQRLWAPCQAFALLAGTPPCSGRESLEIKFAHRGANRLTPLLALI
jgi:hypothetical protein